MQARAYDPAPPRGLAQAGAGTSAGASQRPIIAARPGGYGVDEQQPPSPPPQRSARRRGDARHRLCDFFTVCDCAGEYLYDMNQINLLCCGLDLCFSYLCNV